jgi:hypothetical protein
VLVEDGEFHKFAKDYRFHSPSTAAAVVLGSTANGLVQWKDKNGVTLGKLQGKSSQEG